MVTNIYTYISSRFIYSKIKLDVLLAEIRGITCALGKLAKYIWYHCGPHRVAKDI